MAKLQKTPSSCNKKSSILRFQAVLLCLVTILVVVFSIIYFSINKSYEISYNEKGSVHYRVKLSDNDYFEDELQYQNKAYPSNLIDEVKLYFNYGFDVDSKELLYNYNYKIVAKLIISDNDSNKVVYNPETILKEGNNLSFNTKDGILSINEDVVVNYNEYIALSNDFLLNHPNITNTTSKVVVEMNFDIKNYKKNFYKEYINIPLTNDVVDISLSAFNSTNNGKLINLKMAKPVLLRNLLLTFAILDVVVLVVFVILVILNRKNNTVFENSVQKLIYISKPHVKKVKEAIDKSKYKVVFVDNLYELLNFKDSFSKPILVYENIDAKTYQFYVEDSTTLYVYEVNSLGQSLNNIITEVAITDSDESLDKINVSNFNWSFKAKLLNSNIDVKQRYRDLISKLSTYDKLKVVESWKKLRVYSGRTDYAQIFFKGKTLCVALALDPKAFADTKYVFEDISDVTKYKDTPMLVRLTSNRQVNYLSELLDVLLNTFKKVEGNICDEKLPYKTKAQLVKNGDIKVNTKEVSASEANIFGFRKNK